MLTSSVLPAKRISRTILVVEDEQVFSILSSEFSNTPTIMSQQVEMAITRGALLSEANLSST
jgi:hypothetical protein